MRDDDRRFARSSGSAATEREHPAVRSIAASLFCHGLVLAAFVLPIGRDADAPLPVVATLLFAESGTSGAAGAGAGGGGDDASPTAPESRSAPPVESEKDAQSSEASAEQAAIATPSVPKRELAQIPEKPEAASAPPVPRAKPDPPRVMEPEAVPHPPAKSTPGPASGAGMAARAPAETGTSGDAGRGRGIAGGGEGALGERAEGPGDEYFNRLRRHLLKYQRWPENRGEKDRGTTLVTFTIERDGTVRDAQIERSSGYASLDQATLDMLRRASPVPPLPANFPGDEIMVSIPAKWKRGIFLKKLF
jgi:protein TonB